MTRRLILLLLVCFYALALYEVLMTEELSMAIFAYVLAIVNGVAAFIYYFRAGRD